MPNSEKPIPHPDLLKRAETLTCQKLELLSCRNDPLYYPKRYREFLARFFDGEEVKTLKQEGFLLAGDPKFFLVAAEYISKRRKRIMEITKKNPDPFIVFLGSGCDMWLHYRSLGPRTFRIYSETYPCSIAGGGDCFINTDYLKLALDHRAVERILTHEPSQLMYDLCLKDDEGNITWQLKNNRLCAEALAGPLNPEAWEDVKVVREHGINFSDLKEDGSNFWPCLEEEWNRYYLRHQRYSGHKPYYTFPFFPIYADPYPSLSQSKEPYLLSPAVKLLYQWATRRGNEEDWWEKAKSIS